MFSFHNKLILSFNNINWNSLFLIIIINYAAIIIFPHRSMACGPDPLVVQPWTLDHAEYSEDYPTQNELPFLSPGNDTRTNLQLLMMDAKPWPIKEINYLRPEKILGDFDEKTNTFNFKYTLNLFDPALFSLNGLGEDFCKKNMLTRANITDATNRQNGEEGSRCDSFNSGSISFISALNNEIKLSSDERSVLAQARKNLSYECNNSSPNNLTAQNIFSSLTAPLPPKLLKPSNISLDFATYIVGAKAFYEGSFDYAVEQFRKLSSSDNLWIKETSKYMIGRTLLNKAQLRAFDNLDGQAVPKDVDKEAAKLAEIEFNKYISEYPMGSYSNSARGLLRRLYWLSGDLNRLSFEYAHQVQNIGDQESTLNSSDLANEIDNKLLNQSENSYKDHNLIAIDALRRMRKGSPDQASFSEKVLTDNKIYFSNNMKLFEFLEAAKAYYVDKNFSKSLEYLGPYDPNDTTVSYVKFSREVLRGQALMAQEKYKEAESHWIKILPLMTMPWQKEAVELGLAITWERIGTINKIFSEDTRVSSARIRAIVLRFIAGPILLREAIENPQSLPEEKSLARYVLLFKEATRGQYANFLKDYKPDNSNLEIISPTTTMKTSSFSWPGSTSPYSCPSLIKVIDELSNQPQSSHGLLCLSEFIRLEELDLFESIAPNTNELGGGKSIFPGKIFSRGEIYKDLISSKSTSEKDRAYALYRAINCYAPTNTNTCGGIDVNVSQRKAWYNQLKSKYGATSWAQSLKHYW